jgi:hypothetical protein
MVFSWIIASAALVVAVVSWVRARRAAARLEELSRMYWELKYEQGELRVQVQRLAGDRPIDAPASSPPAGPRSGFVPLTSLRR